jgi:hypothetical protein
MCAVFPCISARGCFQDLNPWPLGHKATTLLLCQGSPSKGSPVHLAPACARSGEWSNHFRSYVRRLSLHFFFFEKVPYISSRGCFQNLNPWPHGHKTTTSPLRQGSPSRKGSLVHVAPACAGFGEGSDHFGSYVHSLSLHFCKRLFLRLEPMTSWSQDNSFTAVLGLPSPFFIVTLSFLIQCFYFSHLRNWWRWHTNIMTILPCLNW